MDVHSRGNTWKHVGELENTSLLPPHSDCKGNTTSAPKHTERTVRRRTRVAAAARPPVGVATSLRPPPPHTWRPGVVAHGRTRTAGPGLCAAYCDLSKGILTCLRGY
eukprot:gene24640-biopygen13466